MSVRSVKDLNEKKSHQQHAAPADQLMGQRTSYDVPVLYVDYGLPSGTRFPHTYLHTQRGRGVCRQLNRVQTTARMRQIIAWVLSFIFFLAITTTTTAPMDSNPVETCDGKKAKRRKVRSKQKNIRKDSRPLSAKPEHLRLGNSQYSGRPLTKETRQKLHLPASKNSIHRQLSHDRKRKPIIHHELTPEYTANESKIDNILDPDANIVSGESSKRKKSKYKNLIPHET
jgi:hypothetical protein